MNQAENAVGSTQVKHEKFLQLTLCLALTLAPLGILGWIGLVVVRTSHLTLDNLLLAHICLLFALVFGINTLIQARDAGLLSFLSRKKKKEED